jgi:hypothetical protein
MDVGFNFHVITTFGCVILVDDIPLLFMMDGHNLIDGIPLFDDDDLYMTLDDNELILVGVDIKDEEGLINLGIDDINDNNYDELVYVLTPLKFYTLKTPGLTNEDLMDMEIFDLLINNLIDGYIENIPKD